MSVDQALSLVGTFPTENGTLNGFLDAVTVWINKPHVVNRRLCGAKIKQIKTVDSLDMVREVVKNACKNGRGPVAENFNEDVRNLQADLKENEEKFVIIIRELLPKMLKSFPILLEAVVYNLSESSITFLPLQYIHRRSDAREVSTVPGEVTYRFTFLPHQQHQQHSCVQLHCNHPVESPTLTSHAQTSAQWLKETLTPKVASWSQQTNLLTTVRSLRLLDLDLYNQRYAALKEKYAADLVKNWTETTNPEKFVYEDIGIATYLLLLWEEERRRSGAAHRQTFVDLGCGNGLLVHILASEGHSGVGVDLRKRDIWASYGQHVHLEERPITPSADNLFPQYDWIIGNHSDELTPWIPVIAARSSYRCSYFVLPCCPHDFDRRFNGRGQGRGSSVYQSYLHYLGQVGSACGFQVEHDTLRIPSTKRECQIGRHRTYPETEETEADQRRQDFINSRCKPSANSTTAHVTDSNSKPLNSDRTPADEDTADTLKAGSPSDDKNTQSDTSNTDSTSVDADSERHHSNATCLSPDTTVGKGVDPKDRITSIHAACEQQPGRTIPGEGESTVWAQDFAARSGVERVRNCQRVSQTTKDRVVRLVFERVLAADDATSATAHHGGTWRKGGSVTLGAVAQMLDAGTREELKAECGGVQTLLRNHHQIFQVSGGCVQLRDFTADNPWSQHKRFKASRRDATATVKTTLCWFNEHHPDGCPRSDATCAFAHGQAELRPREVKARKGNKQTL